MNSDEIVKILRGQKGDASFNFYDGGDTPALISGITLNSAAALIESLQADRESYQQVKKALQREGYSDIETMISQYKQVMLAAKEEIESLQAQLAASQRREKAAVEDIKHLAFNCADDPLDMCGEVCVNNNGICQRGVATGYGDKCRGFEWRGPQDEKGENNA